LRERLERWGFIEPAAVGSERPATYPAPKNAVSKAWYEFADALGFGDDRSYTPRECAEAARNAGVDEETIDAVTVPFEEVRYGEAPVTEERERRARDGLERFLARHRGGEE
jgi:hypothetical protein